MPPLSTNTKVSSNSLAFLCLTLNPLLVAVVRADSEVHFNRDVRPILSDNCFYCHGFDPKNRKGDLRLDTFEGASEAHDGSKAIVPGDITQSALWARLNSTDSYEIMPPPKAHKTLTRNADSAPPPMRTKKGISYQQLELCSLTFPRS
jgi:hypothetical protein